MQWFIHKKVLGSSRVSQKTTRNTEVLSNKTKTELTFFLRYTESNPV